MSSAVPSKRRALSSKQTHSEEDDEAGSRSSGDDQAGVALPTEEAVRTWDSEDLYKWLTSMTPPPLSNDRQAIQAFLGAKIDGPVFLDLGNKLSSNDLTQIIPFGVARRLNILANSIKDNALHISALRKRTVSSPPIHCQQGKKPRLARGSGLTGNVSQASRGTSIMEGSSRLVEDLAVETNHAIVHKLVGMSLTFFWGSMATSPMLSSREIC